MMKYLLTAWMIVLSAGQIIAQTAAEQTLNAHHFTPGDNEGAIQGTRYLFDTSWAKGFLVSANNTEIRNDSFYFNYDKISQNIFFTEDRKNIYELDKKEVKSFTFQWHDSTYAFQHVEAINPGDFFQVLVQTPDKYSLYKIIHTKFKKADYTSNGISESGSKIDQYVDEPEYYIVLPNKEYRSLISLKKNAVTKAFALNPDLEKVNNFYSTQKNHGTAEGYLKELIRFINM